MSYVQFVELLHSGRKTRVFMVESKDGEHDLGIVQYNPQWRKFCFYPTENTIFDKGCLMEICSFIDSLMEERRQLLKERKEAKEKEAEAIEAAALEAAFGSYGQD